SFVTDPATPEIYTLSLHDALPIWSADPQLRRRRHPRHQHPRPGGRTGRRPGRIALGEVKFNRRCPMAKKWNSRLALVNQPTGDGRRFQAGGVSHRNLPLPLNWQRQSSEGHLTSVTIGSIEELEIREDEVFGRGVLFDDTESESLRADVQHVMELARQGVVKPSVDPGSVQAVEVLAGTDEPLTW